MSLLISCAFSGFLLFGGSVWGAASEKPTSLKGRKCSEAGCHEALKKNRYVHGPVAIDACSSCHSLKDEEKHRFSLAKPEEELCDACHFKVARRKVKHEPVAAGMCAACHDPHSSSTEFLLKAGEADELCVECHDKTDLLGNKKHVHGPVEMGACTACHSPHDSDYPKLLNGSDVEVCTTCHDDVYDPGDESLHVHDPLKQGCRSCHSGHSSDEAKLLKVAAPELCYGCHEAKRPGGEAASPHDKALAKQGCLNCHTPHASKNPGLALKPQVDLCLKCHKQSIERKERIIPSIRETIVKAKFKHGPVQEGTCGACHNVHGEQTFRMLNEAYPEEFYASFAPENYRLCFGCHDQNLAVVAKTTEATGFRNGDRNLHFLHVNKKEKGRTCRACHSPHGSNQGKQIRHEVNFGDWKLPVGYFDTPTGGACESGCHLPKAYDREEPVDYSKPYAPPAVDAEEELEYY